MCIGVYMSTVPQAVKTAIQEGRPPAADTRKVLPENIPDSAKQVACDALDRAYDAYHEAKTGIFALQKKLEEKKERGVGFQALTLASEAVKLCGNDMRLAGPMFRALCGIGEV